MKKVIYTALTISLATAALYAKETKVNLHKDEVYGISCKKIKNKASLNKKLKKHKNSFVADNKFCKEIKKSELPRYGVIITKR